MAPWVLWLIAAAVLAAGEVLTMGFFLAPIAIAAVIAAAVDVAGGSVELQFIVFIAASIASLLIVRPIAKRHLSTPVPLRTNAARLVGAEAIVLQRVDRDGGRVKVGGEEWTARTGAEQSYEPGTRTVVEKIDGATAVVSSGSEREQEA
jgi:membrane protein implicated in regulation of membrane protease activity